MWAVDVAFVGVSTVVLLSCLACGWCAAWRVVLKRSPLIQKVMLEVQTPTMEKRERLELARKRRQQRRAFRERNARSRSEFHSYRELTKKEI